MVDFEEMGLHDLPAEIDYILNFTAGINPLGNKLAAYIGHSQGTTQFFIGGSMRPTYFSEKVNLFVALAPVVRLDHSPNKLMVFAAQFVQQIEWAVRITDFFDVYDLDPALRFLLTQFCDTLPSICLYFEEGILDFGSRIENAKRLGEHYMF